MGAEEARLVWRPGSVFVQAYNDYTNVSGNHEDFVAIIELDDLVDADPPWPVVFSAEDGLERNASVEPVIECSDGSGGHGNAAL